MDYYRRNELPETVKRYKTYTDQFQVWLLKTGTQRGVELANVVADQTKKKKSKKGYRIPLQKQEQLVNAIAATSVPLADTSGINDLGDAIRSRREVTQYHRYNNTADLGHEYFNGSLEALMTALKVLVPGMNKTQNCTNDTPTFVFIQLPTGSKTSQDEQDELLEKMRKRDKSDLEDGGQPQQTPTPRTKKKVPIPEASPLTAEEELLRREFLIICFLYSFNRVRDVLYDVWVLYHKGLVNAITAALVFDLAQDHVHQNVKVLVEELDLLPGGLAILIHQLFDKIKAAPDQNMATLPTEKVLRHLFGLDAAALIKTYIGKTRPKEESADNDIQEHPLSLFLRFFDVIRKGGLKLPKWDHFTGEMLLHQSTSQDYLPFGLAIVLDIQQAVREDYRRMLRDLTEHGLDIARCIRCHVDYEDRMWAKGTKPDYMCREEIKFSTILLNPLERLLEWLQELLDSQEKPMTASVFITVHSTLAGLSMWHFNQIYHHTAIAKIQWFILGIAHLYNAACQMGCLNLRWPDLDYLIKMYGAKVMFRGDPPTHPNDFLNRYLLSSNTSSRVMASDFRHMSDYLPHISRELGAKHGLQPELPLEAKILDYYGPDPDNNRWLRRHAVFNYLYRRSEDTEETPKDDCDEATQNMKDLQDTFANLATNITPSKPRRKGKNKSRMYIPDFDKQGETHANLFGTMKSELQENEVHSHFDFLSFYRRAYDLFLRIREEVLMGDQVQRFRAEDMNANPNPPNFQLITDLFRALQIGPKIKKEEGEAEAEEGAGQQLSTKVVPLRQIRRVAEMIQDLTRSRGDVELERAKLRVKGDWGGLKASYAAEEAGRETSTAETPPTQVEKEMVLEVADDKVGFATSLQIDDGNNRTKRKFEAAIDSEDGPFYAPGNQLLGPKDSDNNLGDILSEATTPEITDTMVDTPNDGVTLLQENQKGDMKRRHEADENTGNGSLHTPSLRDQINDPVDDPASQHVLASTTLKTKQPHSLNHSTKHIMNTAAPTSLAETTPNDQLNDDAEPTMRSPPAIKSGTRPKGMYHRITYSSTTSRKFHMTTFSSPCISKEARILALSRPHRGFFHRLASVAGRRHVAFRCYDRCSMARAMYGRQSRVQRQMAISVAELKMKARRDSAELQRVWLGVGHEEVDRTWETESDVSLD
ncbi:hypothetical protein G6011_01796 [Alternaria panax]|uniref:DUF6604 domain-containing protein n=1 Tax=Alternaria panax TaxID=48097 RepID=A0AAD4NWM4_9PLEO|nr:hypothetical protein G6011_01796 [Alternaria panax]